jgi:CheY-like chemotaxis protein
VTSSLRILLLEDDTADAELIQELLEAEHVVCEVTRVETRAEFVVALKYAMVDLILADYKLPAFDGISALNLALAPICRSSLFPAPSARKRRSKRSRSAPRITS